MKNKMEKLKIYVTILKNYHTEIEMGKNIKYRHKRLDNLDSLSSDERRLREYDNLHIVKFLQPFTKNFKFK